LAKILFSGTSKLKYVQFCEICGYIKRYYIKFFLSLSFVAIFGCGIRDPGVKIIRNEKMNVYLKKMYRLTLTGCVRQSIRNKKVNANFMKRYKLSLIRAVKKTIRNEKMNVYLKRMNVQINPDQMC
jgi:hypothetical protein